MTSVAGKGGLREVRWELQVIGPCRNCGVGAEFWPSHPDCPHEPSFVRDLGVVSRWHKNPFVRLWWRLTDNLRNGD